MNPYDSPNEPRDPTDRPIYHHDPEELAARQKALLVRLGLLAVLTTVISLIGIFIMGLAVVPISILVALVTGILFTVKPKDR